MVERGARGGGGGEEGEAERALALKVSPRTKRNETRRAGLRSGTLAISRDTGEGERLIFRWRYYAYG